MPLLVRGRALERCSPPHTHALRVAAPVSGFGPLRIELYITSGGDGAPAGVSISCAGTVVYDSVTQYEVADLDHAPWNDARLSGLIEFADFQVPPGTRRGVMPDQAALSFSEALGALEPMINAQLEAIEARAVAALDAELLRQLARAFRDLPRLAPEYDLFAVRAEGDGAGRDATGGAARTGPLEAGATIADGAVLSVDSVGASNEPADHEPPSLLPAGRLASALVVPARSRIERMGQHRLQIIGRDANGVRIQRPLRVLWHCDSLLLSLAPLDDPLTTVTAGADTGRAMVRAEVSEETTSVRAEATVDIVDELAEPAGPRPGIPEPTFVDEPAGGWRSRLRDGSWEVNSAHPDFHSAGTSARRKLRYLAALLAKEIVLHSFPMPQLGPALERLVGILTITERQLDSGGGGKSGSKRPGSTDRPRST